MITGRLQIGVLYVCVLQDLKSFCLITFRDTRYLLKTGWLSNVLDAGARFARNPFSGNEIEDSELRNIDLLVSATVQELTELDAGADTQARSIESADNNYSRRVKSTPSRHHGEGFPPKPGGVKSSVRLASSG